MGIEQVVLMIDAPCKGGVAIIFGQNLVYWSAHKQAIMSCSSIAAGYKALANATTKLILV
jgi:hypothetical protein